MKSLLNLALLALALLAGGAARAATPPSEIDALMAFYNGTGGPAWTYHDHWGAGDPCASAAPWSGVLCDAYDVAVTHVVSVVLDGNNIIGPLPASFGGLPALRVLSLRANALTGVLPNLADNPALELLDLSDNQLTGAILAPPLPNFKTFVVENNQLSGHIPALDAWPSLEAFVADHNQLTGTIPSLAALAHLGEFYVNDNHLSGPAPAVPAGFEAEGKLCPNYLTPASTPYSPLDEQWNNATEQTPWSEDCTAEPGTWLVQPSAGAGGSLVPGGAQSVPAVEPPIATSFTLVPDAGYEIDGVTSTCGSGTLNGSVYTTAPITADCGVTATFRAASITPPAQPTVVAVPTLGEWALTLLGLLLAGLALRYIDSASMRR